VFRVICPRNHGAAQYCQRLAIDHPRFSVDRRKIGAPRPRSRCRAGWRGELGILMQGSSAGIVLSRPPAAAPPSRIGALLQDAQHVGGNARGRRRRCETAQSLSISSKVQPRRRPAPARLAASALASYGFVRCGVAQRQELPSRNAPLCGEVLVENDAAANGVIGKG